MITAKSIDIAHSGASKVERYKWAPLDQSGEFHFVSKHALQVDPAYQRTSSDIKVLALAREWSWVAAGCILVALRGGDYFVFDGQHRVMAARRRADISVLPCMVYNIPTLRDEALAYLRANCNRKAVTVIDRFRALTMTENGPAQIARELAEQAGRTIRKDGADAHSITCVAAIMALAETNEAELRRIWPLFVEICSGEPMLANLIRALVYIEARLPAGESLASGEWRRRVVKVGAVALVKATYEAAAYYAKGGARVYADGVLKRLNFGCRKHITLVGTEAA